MSGSLDAHVAVDVYVPLIDELLLAMREKTVLPVIAIGPAAARTTAVRLTLLPEIEPPHDS